MTTRDKTVHELWDRACMGYNVQHVDPAVLEEFAVLIAKKCLNLNTTTINDMKADDTINMPGAEALMELVRIECRDRIHNEFDFD